MRAEEKKLLLDIEQAALNIDIHLEKRRVYEEFVMNITKRRAIERELEIIGEATHNLLKIESALLISSARKIVGMRNRIIHAYDSIDETILWKIIIKDIPILLDEVQELLDR